MRERATEKKQQRKPRKRDDQRKKEKQGEVGARKEDIIGERGSMEKRRMERRAPRLRACSYEQTELNRD